MSEVGESEIPFRISSPDSRRPFAAASWVAGTDPCCVDTGVCNTQWVGVLCTPDNMNVNQVSIGPDYDCNDLVGPVPVSFAALTVREGLSCPPSLARNRLFHMAQALANLRIALSVNDGVTGLPASYSALSNLQASSLCIEFLCLNNYALP